MNKERLDEINKLHGDPRTVEILCNLPEDRYRIVIGMYKLANFLEHQKVTNNDVKLADDVYTAYSLIGAKEMALRAFIFGKIQGKREERLKRKH